MPSSGPRKTPSIPTPAVPRLRLRESRGENKNRERHKPGPVITAREVSDRRVRAEGRPVGLLVARMLGFHLEDVQRSVYLYLPEFAIRAS
jgi:hypothetical protein